jgi:hypothetical protein
MADRIKIAAKSFFDKPAVTNAVDKARIKVLSRQGALVRKIARNSMRKKKKASAPGQPPRVILGQVKDFLYFVYDPTTKTVVVGPIKLGDKSEALPTLERGGEMKVSGLLDSRGRFVPLRFLPAVSRQKLLQSGKLTTRFAKVAARPFMIPALEKAKPYLAGMYKDTVKK